MPVCVGTKRIKEIIATFERNQQDPDIVAALQELLRARKKLSETNPTVRKSKLVERHLEWVLHRDVLTCANKEWRLIVCIHGKVPRVAATVWGDGTWHTWDKNGVGGENSKEDTVEKAKIEASASAMAQGFI